MKRKKILATFAHPDDEAFGPGGTLAKYAASGVEIHLLCATRGEIGGQNIKSLEDKRQNVKADKSARIAKIREEELLKSAKILGIKKVEFLDFIDGTLCNAIYHDLAAKIIKKIQDFKPQVILTSERRGVSGHLDHIAVSMVTTYAYLKTRIANKLYYYCLPKEVREKRMEEYFIYFPEGYPQKEITTRIDYSLYWKKKVQAMQAHQSQIKDVKMLLLRFSQWPKVDHYILQYYQGVKVHFPESDFFSGIDS